MTEERRTPRRTPISGAELDSAVLGLLAGGDPKTRDELQKATSAASAHLASSLRRLSMESLIVETSLKGKRAYQEASAYAGTKMTGASTPPEVPEAEDDEA